MSSTLPSHGMEVDADPFTSKQPAQHNGARPKQPSASSGSRGRQSQTPRQAPRSQQATSSGSQSRGTRGQTSSSTRPPTSQSRRHGSMDSGCPPTDSVLFGGWNNDQEISTDALASYRSTSSCDSQSSTSEVLRDASENLQKMVQEKLDRSISSSSSKSTSALSTSTIGSSQPPSLSSMSSDQEQGVDLVPTSPKVLEHFSKMPQKLKLPYYDGIIICAEEDIEAVTLFKDRVMRDVLLYGRYKPRVILYEELVLPGQSMFRALETALERSTYVFLFVTKCFCEDTWAEHLSDSCLMEAINNPDKQWCVVPIFTTSKKNSEFRIPVSLNSLKGVQYWTKDGSYFLEAVQRLLEDKINIRRQNEEKLEAKREAWLIDHEIKMKIQQARKERELKETRAKADKELAAFHYSPSVPSFSQEEYSKSQESSNMHSSSSLPTMQSLSIQAMGAEGQDYEATGGSFPSAGVLPLVAGLNRSDSQSTTSLHSSLSSQGPSIRGADPTLVRPPSFHSLPQNLAPRAPRAPNPGGPLSLPIPEGSDVPWSHAGSWGVMGNAQQQQGSDLTEDSPQSLLGGRVPNSSGSSAGSSVDPPSMPSRSSTSSQQGPGHHMAETAPRNIPGQVPTVQNTPQHSSLPSSLGQARSSGSGGSSDQDSGPVVRREIHYHYHYHHLPPAQSQQAPSGQTVVYNINNAEVVQIGRHNLVQNSRSEDPPVFDCESSSSASNLSFSSASSRGTSPPKPAPEPKRQQTEAVPEDHGDNRLPPPSVISEDNPRSVNPRSVPGPITQGLRQGQGEEETPEVQGLAERGLIQLSSVEGPCALPRGYNQETDTIVKQPRSGSSLDETESSSQAEEKANPVKPVGASPPSGKTLEAKEKASQSKSITTSPPSNKTESPVKLTPAEAVVKPFVSAAPLPQNQPGTAVQYRAGKQVVVVTPMVRKPAPDSHLTEVKQPVDSSLTTPKVYHQGEEAISPSDHTRSEEEEKEDEAKEEDREKGKGHTASGEEKVTVRKQIEQTPKKNTSPALCCQVAMTHPLQTDPSPAEGNVVEQISPDCNKDNASGISFREGEDKSTADDKDSSTPRSVARGADPTLVQGVQRGSWGVEFGPVYTNSTAWRSGSQQGRQPNHSQGPFNSPSRRSESSPTLGTHAIRAPRQSTSHQSLQGFPPGNGQQQEGGGRGTYPLQSSTRNSRDRDRQIPRGSPDLESKKNCCVS